MSLSALAQRVRLHPLSQIVKRVSGRQVRYGSTLWTKTDLAVRSLSSETDTWTEAILHELCHFIVATPVERSMYNLGLTGLHADHREAEALCVQIWLEDAADVSLAASYDQTESRGKLKQDYPNHQHAAIRAERKLAAFDRAHPGVLAEIDSAIRHGS